MPPPYGSLPPVPGMGADDAPLSPLAGILGAISGGARAFNQNRLWQGEHERDLQALGIQRAMLPGEMQMQGYNLQKAGYPFQQIPGGTRDIYNAVLREGHFPELPPEEQNIGADSAMSAAERAMRIRALMRAFQFKETPGERFSHQDIASAMADAKQKRQLANEMGMQYHKFLGTDPSARGDLRRKWIQAQQDAEQAETNLANLQHQATGQYGGVQPQTSQPNLGIFGQALDENYGGGQQ